MSKKVLIETYGCQMNEADTELMFGLLRKQGYEITTEQTEADVVLLNTCAVRERAEERIFGRLGWLKDLKRKNPDLVLGVTGCMAERMREKLIERTPYVDLVVGPDAYRRLPDLVDELIQRGDAAETTPAEQLAQEGSSPAPIRRRKDVDRLRLKDVDPIIDVKLDKREMYERAEVDRVPGVSGWISVQRGCDKFCSFCIVPFVRGRERSLSPDEVVTQAREMSQQGFREVTLLGQTVSSYYERGCDFADLLSMVHEVEGIERIRFTSPYPNDFTPRLLERLGSLPKVGRNIHLPVQSGSSRILKDMRRGYTRERFLDLMKSAREILPDYSFSTDIIVGYPSETDEDFEETMSLMREVRFDSAFMFYYSERDGTLAARKKPDDVPLDIKKGRLRRLIDQQEGISAEVNQVQLGREHEVLVIGPTRRNPNQVMGRSSCFRTTIFDQKSLNNGGYYPGDIVRVKIKRATSHTLFGEVSEVVSRAPLGPKFSALQASS
jgi:tRNA-2-methylthio-N6-dimethylallyladenosine synthase